MFRTVPRKTPRMLRGIPREKSRTILRWGVQEGPGRVQEGPGGSRRVLSRPQSGQRVLKGVPEAESRPGYSGGSGTILGRAQSNAGSSRGSRGVWGGVPGPSGPQRHRHGENLQGAPRAERGACPSAGRGRVPRPEGGVSRPAVAVVTLERRWKRARHRAGSAGKGSPSSSSAPWRAGGPGPRSAAAPPGGGRDSSSRSSLRPSHRDPAPSWAGPERGGVMIRTRPQPHGPPPPWV